MWRGFREPGRVSGADHDGDGGERPSRCARLPPMPAIKAIAPFPLAHIIVLLLVS